MHQETSKRISSHLSGANERFRGASSLHFVKLLEDEGDTGFWTHDIGTDEGTFTPGTAKILGIPAGENLNCINLLDFIHVDDRHLYEETISFLKTGQSINIDLRIFRSDRTARWVNVKAEVLFDGEGNPLNAVGVLRDITKFRNLDESLSRSRERNRSLIQLVGGVEWGVNRRGDLLYKHSWSELTGQNSNNAQAWGWLELVHQDDRALAKSSCLKAMERQSAIGCELRVLCREIGYRTFRLKAAPSPLQEPTISEWSGLISGDHGAVHAINADDFDIGTIVGRHIAAARALLEWTHEDLANKASISVSSVRRIEAGARLSRRTLISVVSTLQNEGVRFWQRDDVTVGLGLATGNDLT
jgi:PAS domain S-box-containing protein